MDMEVAQVESDDTKGKMVYTGKKVHLDVRCFKFPSALNRP